VRSSLIQNYNLCLPRFLGGPQNQRAIGGPRGVPAQQCKVSFAWSPRRDYLRFFAAAVAAFLARADRSSGVMVSRLFLPPREPSSAITCRIISRETRFAMTPVIRTSAA